MCSDVECVDLGRRFLCHFWFVGGHGRVAIDVHDDDDVDETAIIVFIGCLMDD